jgi:hypothetical protein
MALLDLIGIRDGGSQQAFLQLHWAAATLLLIPIAYRAGGFFAAVLCALWPELLYFAPHTLTEVPSAILATWGIGLWIGARGLEGVAERRALLWAGGLLSFAVCLRLPNAPLAAVPVLDLLVRRRWSALATLLLGSLGPVLLFGAVDLLTWGRPFHSELAFLNYNLLQGRAAEHGTSPWNEYDIILVSRTSYTLLLILLAAFLSWRRTWPALAPALLLVAVLSTQPHKEERLILAAWPLLAVAWGAAMEGRSARTAWVGTALILLGTGYGVLQMPARDYTGRSGLYAAQSWVGQQSDAAGLLIEGHLHLSGGFMRLSRNLPMETFYPRLLLNPIFTHATLPDGSVEEQWCEQMGMRRVWQQRGWSVWRRDIIGARGRPIP